jgi:hypothetical protein
VKVRFQADNDLDRTIVRGVLRRRPLVDFRSQPINDVDDLTVLHLAAQDGRILVSHDISTMPEAFGQYRQSGHSPGVLLVPQLWPVAGGRNDRAVGDDLGIIRGQRMGGSNLLSADPPGLPNA